MDNRKIKAEELAYKADISLQTLNNWYRYKRLYPDTMFGEMLPEYEKIGGRGTRYWDITAIEQLKRFKAVLPKGRNGILGDVTHKERRVKNEDVV